MKIMNRYLISMIVQDTARAETKIKQFRGGSDDGFM